MIKKINTYVLNGKELSKDDLKNYLVFEPNMIEENIKKVLKYDKIENALENDCFNNFSDENELIIYEKVKKNNKVGFFKNNKKVISPLYDDGHFINGTFVMENGLDIYMFDEDGKNLILDNKISEICSNISKYFDLNLKGNDMETLYKLLSIKIISKKGFLYDLENDKIVSADRVIKKYKLSTEKREIIIDRTNKKVKTIKK